MPPLTQFRFNLITTIPQIAPTHSKIISSIDELSEYTLTKTKLLAKNKLKTSFQKLKIEIGGKVGETASDLQKVKEEVGNI